MRVGIVCPYSLAVPGGVQAHVLGFASWLREQGHLSYVLAPEVPDTAPNYVMNAGAARNFPYNGSVARVAVGMQAVFATREWLRLGRFDVVHVHEPLVPLLGLTALCAARPPVVATFHTQGIDPPWLERGLRAVPWQRRIAASIAVSPYAAELAQRRLQLHPQVIGNGIKIPPPTPPAPPTQPPTAVFVGRFDEPRKGFRTLLHAWELVRHALPPARLLVVGPGTPVIAPGVEYLGPLNAARRDQLLRKAAMLVAPHTGQESFGLVLVEALACDTPVVASDLVEFRTTLSDDTGTVAVLVPPENAPALAAAIIDTFQRPPDTERGRAVAARYSWDSIGPQILALYQQAIS